MQGYYAKKYTRSLEEIEDESLESQVTVIKQRQDEIDIRQDQRLESLVTTITALKRDVASLPSTATKKPSGSSPRLPPAGDRKLVPIPHAAKPQLKPPELMPKKLVLPPAAPRDAAAAAAATDDAGAEAQAPASAPASAEAPPRYLPGGRQIAQDKTEHGTTPATPPPADDDTSVDRTDTASDDQAATRAPIGAASSADVGSVTLPADPGTPKTPGPDGGGVGVAEHRPAPELPALDVAAAAPASAEPSTPDRLGRLEGLRPAASPGAAPADK